MTALEDYIATTDQLTALNRYFIQRVFELKAERNALKERLATIGEACFEGLNNPHSDALELFERIRDIVEGKEL